MNSPNHPIWSILRFCVGWGALYLILKSTAQSFDETEARTLTWMAIVFAGGETLLQTVTRLAPTIVEKLLRDKIEEITKEHDASNE